MSVTLSQLRPSPARRSVRRCSGGFPAGCPGLGRIAVALMALLPWCATAADGGVSPSGSILRMLVGLAVVVAVMLALAWLLRRLGGGTTTGTGPIRVVASVAVGQRERVVLLVAGDRQLLVGVAPGRVTALGDVDGELPLDLVPARPDFAANLQSLLGRAEGSR